MSTSAQRWAKWFVYSTGVIFGGWALMRSTTPNPQEFYDSLAPDHKRAVDAARARGVGISQPTESLRRQQTPRHLFGPINIHPNDPPKLKEICFASLVPISLRQPYSTIISRPRRTIQNQQS
ncbi:hypothetical protein RSAG8_02146, partial [Rhizoctonia solani AG-8 WAC10335]